MEAKQKKGEGGTGPLHKGQPVAFGRIFSLDSHTKDHTEYIYTSLFIFILITAEVG